MVWPRCALAVLEPAVRQLVFELVHGLIRNRARLFDQRRVEDPWCRACPEVAGRRPRHDTTHIFTGCSLVGQTWKYVRALVRRHQPSGELLTDKELVSFTFPAGGQDREVVWILANYFHVVWSGCEIKGRELQVFGVRGLLRSKVKSEKLRNSVSIWVHI